MGVQVQDSVAADVVVWFVVYSIEEIAAPFVAKTVLALEINQYSHQASRLRQRKAECESTRAYAQ